MDYARCTFETPLGAMTACATARGVCLLEFHDRRALSAELVFLGAHFGTDFPEAEHVALSALRSQLGQYFAGLRGAFDVPLDAPATPFQRRVWDALVALPCGATTSYLSLARTVGQPAATRAVARANGQNRIAVVIPCHRVIGSDGSLTGYGGKLWRKRWLIDHEARMAGATLAFA